jgi:hypothetical protein
MLDSLSIEQAAGNEAATRLTTGRLVLLASLAALGALATNVAGIPGNGTNSCTRASWR